MREDVRDAEVRVALVGDVLRAAEEQGIEGRDEGGAAVSEAGAGGAGCGGCASDWRVAVAVRIPKTCCRLRFGRKFQSEILRFARMTTLFKVAAEASGDGSVEILRPSFGWRSG